MRSLIIPLFYGWQLISGKGGDGIIWFNMHPWRGGEAGFPPTQQNPAALYELRGESDGCGKNVFVSIYRVYSANVCRLTSAHVCLCESA